MFSLSSSKIQEGKWVLGSQVQGGMMSVVMFINKRCKQKPVKGRMNPSQRQRRESRMWSLRESFTKQVVAAKQSEGGLARRTGGDKHSRHRWHSL